MSTEDPVSVWIEQLRNADDAAASHLWNHFVQRLYDSARNRLRPETRRVYDEEDAVQSGFQSFCAGIAAGRYPQLQDREGLWRLLLSITARKVSHRHRFDQQLRRNVRRNQPDPFFAEATEQSLAAAVDGIASREPSPEFAAQFVEMCERLMQSLEDPSLQKVATLRMEGYSDTEIADQLGCSRSTVQRRLEVVRRHWQRLELSDE